MKKGAGVFFAIPFWDVHYDYIVSIYLSTFRRVKYNDGVLNMGK